MTGARIWYRNHLGAPIGDISVMEDVGPTIAAITAAKEEGKRHIILTRDFHSKAYGEVAVPVDGVWEITESWPAKSRE